MALKFEEGTYTETKTGHRAVYVCDSCGKEVKGQFVGEEQASGINSIPGWFTLTPAFEYRNDGVPLLCSRQCVKEWALQPEAAPGTVPVQV